MVAFSSIGQRAQNRVTSIDVAKRAGVSQSTVSLVLSDKSEGRISEATQERVRRSARELGYRPNAAAQALRLGSARAVALFVPDITNPFFSRVLRGAQRAAAQPATWLSSWTPQTTVVGRLSRSRPCAPGRWTATCSSRSPPRRRSALTRSS